MRHNLTPGTTTNRETNAPPYRNRFNADGNYWLWNYEQQKTPAEFARDVHPPTDLTYRFKTKLFFSTNSSGIGKPLAWRPMPNSKDFTNGW
jgi:hypothetical protein